MNNNFEVPLSKAVKGALTVLAKESGLTHVRDEVFAKEGRTLVPTPLGWEDNIRFSYKKMYNALVKQYEELKIMYDGEKGTNRLLKESLKDVDGKTLFKVRGILSSRISNDEMVRELKRYLGIKKEGR